MNLLVNYYLSLKVNTVKTSSRIYYRIYKIYIDMAERLSASRQLVNSYFLSINTAIVAFIGYTK